MDSNFAKNRENFILELSLNVIISFSIADRCVVDTWCSKKNFELTEMTGGHKQSLGGHVPPWPPTATALDNYAQMHTRVKLLGRLQMYTIQYSNY